MRITQSRAPEWRTFFRRLRALTICIPVAERLQLGDAAMATREGRATGMRSLRLVAGPEPPKPAEAMIYRTVVCWAGPQLEEVGCDSESHPASQAIVSGAY